MARYWVGGTGTWDSSTTTHWSTTDGGAGGASVPTSTDDVYFTASSNNADYTCTTSGTIYCANLSIVNPSSGTLTFTGVSSLNIYGNTVVSSSVTYTKSNNIVFQTSGTSTVDFGGISYPGTTSLSVTGTGILQLTNNFYIPNAGLVTSFSSSATIDFNGYNYTASNLQIASGTTVDFGEGIIELTGASNALSTPSGATVICGTSTIKLNQSGTAITSPNFGGHTYYDVLITGSTTYAVEISQSNTFHNITIANQDQVVKFYSGTTQTINSIIATGAALHLITLQAKSGTATIKKIGGGPNSNDYMSVSNLIGSPTYAWYMGTHSTNGGGNTNIYFTAPPSGNLLAIL